MTDTPAPDAPDSGGPRAPVEEADRAAETDLAWTLDRVAEARPAVAPLVALHRALGHRTHTVLAELGRDEFRPQFPGPPAVHWFQGKALLDVADPSRLAPALGALFGQLLQAIAEVFPGLSPVTAEIRTATAEGAFDWARELARFRAPDAMDGVPHAPLARFVLMRAVAAPATELAARFSPPHADRWTRGACPYCGLAAIASVAAAGTGRRLICVLCGGRWTSATLDCVACGEQIRARIVTLAAREAGPASLEGCETCHAAIKVFSAGDVPAGAPIALELMTLPLDLVAERDEGYSRDAVARASFLPPA